GVDSWTRCFTVELVEQPLPSSEAAAGEGDWQVFATPGHPLAEPLREAFARYAGRGVVVALPPRPGESEVGILIEAAHAALAAGKGTRFVMVEDGGGAAALARTLYVEAPWITTCVVNTPIDHSQAVRRVVAEALTATGYSEAHYDADGKRRTPVLKPQPQLESPPPLALGPADVMLITGGGKGIAAEAALALARDTGVR